MAKKRTGRLQNSILYSSLFTIVGILVVLFPLTYSIAANLLQKNALTYAEQMLHQVDNSINYYVDGMVSVSDYILEDNGVIDYVGGDNGKSKQLTAESLKTIAGTRPDFVNLIIFREDGQFVANRKDMVINPSWNYRTQDWYLKAINAKGEPVLSSSRVENIVNGRYDWVVSMSRALYSNGKLSAVLLIDLNYKQIADICSSMSYNNNGYIFVMGADNRLVYHPQQRLIYSGIKTEKFELVSHDSGIHSQMSQGYIYTSSFSENSGWVTVSVLNTNQLVSISTEIIAFYCVVGLAFSIVAFIISYAVSRRLTGPILELKTSMKQFETGDFGAKANITVNNEIFELGESFNSMTQRIKHLVEQELLIEEQKRKSELQTLQSQIRPHFLYNTLESIIWMAEMGENDKVVEMTSSLSKLFRASIRNASELVTLQTETDYVENYMTIQKMRYQDKLNFRMEIEPELLNAKVLRLIIQPMVENAIYHGIKKLKTAGWIIVSAKAENDRLIIRIYDNGVGFTASPNVTAMDPGNQNNIGISNVHNRIQLFFGSDYGITIESAESVKKLTQGTSFENMHTIVTLTLPLIFE